MKECDSVGSDAGDVGSAAETIAVWASANTTAAAVL